MDFFAQVGVIIVIALIVYIIGKSNKSLEKAYLLSKEVPKEEIKQEEQKIEKRKEQEMEKQEEQKTASSKKERKLERSFSTVASDLVIHQEKRRKELDFSIWTMDAGGRLDKEIEVDHYPFTIGREEDNDFCIEDNSVSSHHARIIKEGEHIILEDTNSLNKIFVNGRQTLNVELKDELCIFLGNTELYFEKMN